mmetsp:Transcript_25971/g.44082  ORF Transcript_25971/g.44082 Transcript_25971/m.44082 type:complete len:235 (-) Transcript_25971:1286-1990(-)
MVSRNLVLNDLSGGDNAACAQPLKHLVTISSSDDCTVPSALCGPDASCLSPFADRRANSANVTFWGAELCLFGANDPFVLFVTPLAVSPAPLCEVDKSNVSLTISAPSKCVPEKADSIASIASSILMRPSSSSSARSNELLNSISEIMPVLFPPPSPASTAGEDFGSNRFGRDARRNFSKWHNRPTISSFIASSSFCFTNNILRSSFSSLPIISHVCTYKLCRSLRSLSSRSSA